MTTPRLTPPRPAPVLPVPAAPSTPLRDVSAGAPVPAGAGRWRVLPVLAAAQFMVVLDASIVNIAIPSIQSDLGFAAADLQWIINAYVLAFGGLLLLGGRLTDLIDGRKVFLLGLGVFGAASVGCALATSPGLLLGGRVAQGIGAALLSPAGLALLTRTFTGGRRATALAAWGAMSGVAGAAGVLLGGVLTQGPGWQWIFYINIPVALAVGAGALVLVPRTRTVSSGGLDVPGATLVTASIVALVYAVVRSEQDGWTSPVVLGVGALSAVLLVAFLLVERRVSAPLVPLGVFRLRDLSAGNAVNALLGAVLLATFFLLTLYLQQVRGDSALDAGLAYLPLAAAAFVGSGVCAQLLPRAGARALLVTGMALMAAGLGWFSLIGARSDLLTAFLAPSVVFGAGLGIAAVAALAAATHDLGGEGESGLASGLVSTTQQVGGAVGLAVLSTLTFSRTDDLLATGAAFPVALLDGLVLAMRLGAGVALLGAVLAAVALSPARKQADGSTNPAPHTNVVEETS